MNDKTLSKWDKRYQKSSHSGEPCWVLKEHRHLLPSAGCSLDLACGLGANALLLAEVGLESHAWDSSAVALEKLNQFAQQQALRVITQQRDIEREPPGAESFDVIVVSQFLYRPIFSDLAAALKPGGLLFYQTFHRHKPEGQGPSNPNFLLERGELLQQLSELKLVFYREDSDIGCLQQGLRDMSYFIGRKNSGWT